jgi:hypothetical protein
MLVVELDRHVIATGHVWSGEGSGQHTLQCSAIEEG